MLKHYSHWKVIGKKEHRIYKGAVVGSLIFLMIQLFVWAFWIAAKYADVGAGGFLVFAATTLMILSVVYFYLGAAEILQDTDPTRKKED
jgi:hypothetical protein